MIKKKNIETDDRIDIRRLYYTLRKEWDSKNYGYLLFGRFTSWSYEDAIFISKGPYVIEIFSRLRRDCFPNLIIITAKMIEEKDCSEEVINEEIEKIGEYLKTLI